MSRTFSEAALRRLEERLARLALGKSRGRAAREDAREMLGLLAGRAVGRRRVHPDPARQLALRFGAMLLTYHPLGCRAASCWHPDHLFDCPHLGTRKPDGKPGVCRLPRRVCVLRQRTSDSQRRDTQRYRGDGLDFPYCVTDRCAEGRANREALDPERLPRRGGGNAGQFAREKPSAEKNRELAARDRLHAVGLLDDVATIDRHDLPGAPVDEPS